MLWCEIEKGCQKNREYSWHSGYIYHTRRSCLIRPENVDFIFKQLGMKAQKYKQISNQA